MTGSSRRCLTGAAAIVVVVCVEALCSHISNWYTQSNYQGDALGVNGLRSCGDGRTALVCERCTMHNRSAASLRGQALFLDLITASM
jgi:hypothetical protein